MENKKERIVVEKAPLGVPRGEIGGDKPTFRLFITQRNNANFYIKLCFKSPTTGRGLTKEFAILVPSNTKNRAFWNKEVVLGAALKYFTSIPRMMVMNMKSKREMGNGIYRLLKKITNRVKATEILARLSDEGKRYLEEMESTTSTSCEMPFASSSHTTDETTKNATSTATGDSSSSASASTDSPLTIACRHAIEQIALSLPTSSAFKPEKTGVTYAMLGKSFSGKTTFLVNNLNMLTDQELFQYNAIIYFTKSPNASPLDGLDSRIKRRFIMVGRFCPRILNALKRINDETDLMFMFLVIFDDILNLRGGLLTECILTLRNSNISTALSIQYERLMSPAQRASVHNVYIFNLRTEQWEFFLKGFIVGNIKELVPPLRSVKRMWEIAQVMRDVMNPFILYFDQRTDKTVSYHFNKKS